MCKIGDIIIIDQYRDNGRVLPRHSFIVISDKNGIIGGAPYDMICNVFSSFKSKEQKERKLEYSGNFPVCNDDLIVNPNNGKSGYIKADQLYFFEKSKITYHVIGYMKPDIFQLFLEFLEESDFPLISITDNLDKEQD